MVGLEHFEGDYIVLMDFDLQDDPSEISKLYQKIKEGYYIVWVKRNQRNYGI